jgi:putative MATE family efflux protein
MMSLCTCEEKQYPEIIMKQNHSFFRNVCNLAIPVALQSMLQSSFGIVDQIMIGQLGSVNIAGVGLAVKFSGIFSVVVAALGAVAGIMISQYLGQQDRIEVKRSFFLNLYFALGLAALFTALCLLSPGWIMGFYTTDPATLAATAGYLRILSGTFFSMACATMLSALLRCMEKASLPLYASFLAAAVNTALNYLLIFGRFGFPAMGTAGAAIATVISQFLNLALMFFMAIRLFHLSSLSGAFSFRKVPFSWKQYASILLPILVCEFFWSLGENVYAVIYGRLGTEASAAMTLTGPI